MTAGSLAQDRLVADVGGSNTRIAVFDAQHGRLKDLRVYDNHHYSCLEQVIEAWLREQAAPVPSACNIAVAAPPSHDVVRMSNINWQFTCKGLAQRFDFDRVGWLNDFQANAYALPHLRESDREVLYTGTSPVGRKMAVIGPGTGLGGATIEPVDGQHLATQCEPGQAGISPATERELQLFAQLVPLHGEIHAERLVSGPGLLLLYQTLVDLTGQTPMAASPAEISRAALAQEDDTCVAALDMFCGLLGSACGDFVLANGAYGGVYLAGGILPGMLGFLKQSTFHQRFCNKGVMRDHLGAVPVYAITLPQPGLLGAAHAPL